MSIALTAEPLVGYADFGSPYVDIDEQRQLPAPHRYIHGGFTDSDTRFSFYLPDSAAFERRFFQYITPVPESENSLQGRSGDDDTISFALASGAYLIETNGGGPRAADPFSGLAPSIGAYRANAAAATFSRVVAETILGEGRIFGYAFGGSGGAYRTIGGHESTEGVWDGTVPFVVGSPMAIPNCFTPRLHALRVLGDRLADVADAMDAGGSGDPYKTLNDEQAAALNEVTQMGFPLRSWFDHQRIGMHALAVLYPAVRAMDPGYFVDFWSVSGYLGADPESSIHHDRVVHHSHVVALLSVDDLDAAGIDTRMLPGASTGNADDAWLGRDRAEKVGVRLASAPLKGPGFAELVLQSGEPDETRIVLLHVDGDIAVFEPTDPQALAEVRVGAKVTLDNSGFLAMQTYHRHQVPGPEYGVWDQFRNDDGSPTLPQRAFLVGPHFAAGAAGTLPRGTFAGRMILVESLMDREAYPWQADWYRARVAEHVGAERVDQVLRVWMTDRALHADTDVRDRPDQVVSYGGVLQQALRDLAAWVEHDVDPPASTAYAVERGQVVVPASASQRGGIQPTVELTANGAKRADIRVGESVELVAVAETPEAGFITTFEWDLDADRVFELSSDVSPSRRAREVRTVTFSEPGVYFVTVRVVARRDPNDAAGFAKLMNLSRVRIVVS